jgi:hypothetical protein
MLQAQLTPPKKHRGPAKMLDQDIPWMGIGAPLIPRKNGIPDHPNYAIYIARRLSRYLQMGLSENGAPETPEKDREFDALISCSLQSNNATTC